VAFGSHSRPPASTTVPPQTIDACMMAVAAAAAAAALRGGGAAGSRRRGRARSSSRVALWVAQQALPASMRTAGCSGTVALGALLVALVAVLLLPPPPSSPPPPPQPSSSSSPPPQPALVHGVPVDAVTLQRVTGSELVEAAGWDGGVFTADECEEILRLGSVGGGGASAGLTTGSQQQRDTTVRVSRVSWLRMRDHGWLRERLLTSAFYANEAAGWGYRLRSGGGGGGPAITDAQVARYDAVAGGHYHWHMDADDSAINQPRGRVLSITVQLSDGDAYGYD
jgi:hypothetical protein